MSSRVSEKQRRQGGDIAVPREHRHAEVQDGQRITLSFGKPSDRPPAS